MTEKDPGIEYTKLLHQNPDELWINIKLSDELFLLLTSKGTEKIYDTFIKNIFNDHKKRGYIYLRDKMLSRRTLTIFQASFRFGRIAHHHLFGMVTKHDKSLSMKAPSEDNIKSIDEKAEFYLNDIDSFSYKELVTNYLQAKFLTDFVEGC